MPYSVEINYTHMLFVHVCATYDPHPLPKAPENLPVGGEVGSVLATDPDGANNGIVSHNLMLCPIPRLSILVFH